MFWRAIDASWVSRNNLQRVPRLLSMASTCEIVDGWTRGDSTEVISVEAANEGSMGLRQRTMTERKGEREAESLTDNSDRFGLRGPAGRAEVHGIQYAINIRGFDVFNSNVVV